MELNYLDISAWKSFNNDYESYLTYLKNNEKPSPNLIKLSSLGFDSVKFYCLLKAKVSTHPNGIQSIIFEGLPLDKLFWWDFILKSDLGFIYVVRKPSDIEIIFNFQKDEFNISEFMEYNLKKYSKEIDIEVKKLEKHVQYINHYDSYFRCVEYLWKEIKNLPIEGIRFDPERQAISNNISKDVDLFIESNIKFHSIGKSLLLNCAFMVESFINLFIRITAGNDLNQYPDVLKKHLSSSFKDKLKNMKYYSTALEYNVDIEHKCIIDVLQVMTYRNKYVHFDLSTDLNQIGTVYFDDKFPVYPSYPDSIIVETIKQLYQNPDLGVIEFCYNASMKFIDYIESLIDSRYKEIILAFLRQNPIGFNTGSKRYSMISPDFVVETFY